MDNSDTGKKERRTVKGYMTIEAAFIITWTVFLFVFLIYAGFYLYDKCVLFQDAYVVCFRGSVQKEEGKVLNEINTRIGEQFGRKYFGTDEVRASGGRHGNEVRVYAECRVNVPFANFLTMAGREGWQIRTQARAQVSNPTKIIRKCRMAENIVYYLQQ